MNPHIGLPPNPITGLPSRPLSRGGGSLNRQSRYNPYGRPVGSGSGSGV